MIKEHYAHSREGRPPSEWQPLDVHLKNITELARKLPDESGADVEVMAPEELRKEVKKEIETMIKNYKSE
jgi:predicted DNA-binding transcriptional regulator YafY